MYLSHQILIVPLYQHPSISSKFLAAYLPYRRRRFTEIYKVIINLPRDGSGLRSASEILVHD
jgi:hypothetical protein